MNSRTPSVRGRGPHTCVVVYLGKGLDTTIGNGESYIQFKERRHKSIEDCERR